MTHFVVMQGWKNEGEAFDSLYSDLQSAVKCVESMIKKHSTSEYYTILKVEADHPDLTEEIPFREEGEWNCSCEVSLVAGIGGIEQSVFYSKHRDHLKHNITFIGYTGKLLMENKK